MFLPKPRQFFMLVMLLCLGFCSTISAAELLVSDRGGDRILAFDPTTGALIRTLVTLPANNKPGSMAIVPTTNELWVGSAEGSGFLNRYDLATGALIAANPGFLASDIVYHPGTNTVLVGDLSFSNGIARFNTAGTQIGTLSPGPGVGVAGLSLDTSGNLLVMQLTPFFTGEIYRTNPFTGLPVDLSGMTAVPFITAPPTGSVYGMSNNNILAGQVFGFPPMFVQQYSSTGSPLGTFANTYNPANPALGGTAYSNSYLELGGSLLMTNFGNDKITPPDANFGTTTFNGFVSRYTLGGIYQDQFITMPGPVGSFQPSDLALSPIPEPGVYSVLVLAGVTAWYVTRRRRAC